MPAKVIDFLVYKKRKEAATSKDLEAAKDWSRNMALKLWCQGCSFWGIEPDTKKKGCTHMYRHFYENCPLGRDK